MIHELLAGKKVVLASASPRRRDIFKMLGIKYLQSPSMVEEDDGKYKQPGKVAQANATAKAKAVARKMGGDCIVVAADTVVYVDNRILGKPVNPEEAAIYLRQLAGRTHHVYTGVVVAHGNNLMGGVEKTAVTFETISDDDITAYLATGEPFDKAGAYGIQGFGCQFISGVNGCYFNVMGFPVNLFYNLLRQLIEADK